MFVGKLLDRANVRFGSPAALPNPITLTAAFGWIPDCQFANFLKVEGTQTADSGPSIRYVPQQCRRGNLRFNSRFIPGELAMVKSALNSWFNYFKIRRHIEVAWCEKTVMPYV